MNLLEKITKDLRKEFKAGIAFIKEGTAVIAKKTREVSAEEQKHLKVIELKTKIKEQMAALGGRIYDINLKVKDPIQDKTVKELLGSIKKIEDQIAKLEKKAMKSVKAISKKGAILTKKK
jgi:hypothetical protein